MTTDEQPKPYQRRPPWRREAPPIELRDLPAITLGEDELRALVPTGGDLDALAARWDH